MFVPCIIRRSRNNQHYALNCVTPLFNTLDPTYFGTSLPSSGSLLDPSELLEIQIEYVVYHIMYVYVACVLPSWVLMHSAGKHNKQNHNTPAHRPHEHTLYDTPPIRSAFQATQTDARSSLMMADYCRNMYKPVYWIKEWYNSMHSIGCSYYKRYLFA
jgi:hypothetical protein